MFRSRMFAGALVPLAFGLSTALAQSTAPLHTASGSAQSREAFRVLDDVEAPWVNLGVVPIRPMLVLPEGLYALNAHANQVVRFVGESAAQTFSVPWGPVAIAARRTPSADELLVVCRGTHVLARLARATGETIALLDLPFEPADILVDAQRDRAYVACSGADSVVEIDLATNAIAKTYALRAKHPVFLSFDAQKRVLVAPQLSGNNSGTLTGVPGGLDASPFGIVDFATNPNVVVGLPDEDLFRIDPVAGTVTPVAKGTGSVLFAHGVNPVTGALWQLNTEADNKDPERQTEALVRGTFVQNRVTIVALPAGAGLATSHAFTNLDDVDPLASGVQFDRARSVGQPYALAFNDFGEAAVCGLLTDNVVWLDKQGRVESQIDLAPGSIPRGVAFDLTQRYLWVYCWGRNAIDMFQLEPTPVLVATHDLGFDPTPPLVAAGRALYYSARFSQHNNASCNSCHIEGRTDMLVWNLSDASKDDKGPMMTQTLASIERTGPLHWRGERPRLSDFNAAFDGLLGGVPLSLAPGGEFERFQAFVFSIQSPANPLQHPTRTVADHGGLPPPPGFPAPQGSALRGQQQFFDGEQDGGASCNSCHMLPAGTSGDIVATGKLDPIPRRTHLKIPAFLEMWRKEQPLVPVTFLHKGTQQYPLLGGALTHAGRSNSLFDFIDDVFHFVAPPEKADLLAFLSQVDQGIAPAAHRAVHLAPSTLGAARTALVELLLPQALARNIDVAAYGRVDFGQGFVPTRWAWNHEQEVFESDSSRRSSRPLEFFLRKAEEGRAHITFVGLPLGTGRGFGIDHDRDELRNGDETVLGTRAFARDTDGDAFGDGYEVEHGSNPKSAASLPVDTVAPTVANLRILWTSATVAAVAFETSEPVSYRIAYAANGGPTSTVRDDSFQRSARVLLTGLEPSSGSSSPSLYTGTLHVSDESGRTTAVALPPIRAGDFSFTPTPSGAPAAPFTAIVGDLRWELGSVDANGTLSGTAIARVDKKVAMPGAQRLRDHVVIATLLRNGQRVQSFASPLPRAFTVMGHAPAFPGPFVMSLPTQDDGIARLSFTLPGMAVGDEVTLVIEAVAATDPAAYDPLAPDFGSVEDPLPLSRWSFGDTPEAARTLSASF